MAVEWKVVVGWNIYIYKLVSYWTCQMRLQRDELVRPVVSCSPADLHVRGLWWLIYAISCFRVFALETKACLFVVTSTFVFRDGDTTNKGWQHEWFLPADTKFSTKKFSWLRLLKCRYFAWHVSCFRVFAPKGEITTKRHVFVSSPFGAKTRKHEIA